MGQIVESIASIHGTYSAFKGIKNAHQQAKSKQTFYRLILHPLYPIVDVTSILGVKIIGSTLSLLPGKKQAQQWCIKKITGLILTNRHQITEDLRRFEKKINALTERFAAIASRDPTIFFEALKLLSRDLKINVRDAVTILKSINAFYASVQDVKRISYNKLESSFNEQQKIEEEQIHHEYVQESKKISESAEANQTTEIKRTAQRIFQDVKYYTNISITRVKSSTKKTSIKVLGECLESMVKLPEEQTIKVIIDKILNVVSNHGALFSVRAVLNLCSFNVYSYAIDLFFPGAALPSLKALRNMLNYAIWGMLFFYYFDAIHRWVNQRRDTQQKADLITNVLSQQVVTDALNVFINKNKTLLPAQFCNEFINESKEAIRKQFENI